MGGTKKKGKAKKKKKNTKHGKARIAKRMGVSKRRADTIAETALKKGAEHKDTTGDLELYLNSLFLRYTSKASCFRIYQDFVFIYNDHGQVITSWELPDNLKFRKFVYASALSNKKPFKDSTDPDGKPTPNKPKKKATTTVAGNNKPKTTAAANKPVSKDKKQKKTVEKLFPDFEKEIKRLRKIIDSKTFENIDELDAEVARIKNSHMSNVEKIAYTMGVVKKYYESICEQDKLEYSYEDAIKRLSYDVMLFVPIMNKNLSKKLTRKEEKEIWDKQMELYCEYVLKRRIALSSIDNWTYPAMRTDIDIDGDKWGKAFHAVNHCRYGEYVKINIQNIYRQMLEKYLPFNMTKNEFLRLKKESMYYIAFCDPRISYDNTKIIDDIDPNKLSEKQKIRDIRIKIEKNKESHRSLAEVCLLEQDKYPASQLEPFNLAMYKVLLASNYKVLSKYEGMVEKANEICYFDHPVHCNSDMQTMYNAWCRGTIDAYIKNAILKRKSVDVDELKAFIKSKKHKWLKNYSIRRRDIERREAFIRKNYSEYAIRCEAYIASQIEGSLLTAVMFPKPPSGGGGY